MTLIILRVVDLAGVHKRACLIRHGVGLGDVLTWRFLRHNMNLEALGQPWTARQEGDARPSCRLTVWTAHTDMVLFLHRGRAPVAALPDGLSRRPLAYAWW